MSSWILRPRAEPLSAATVLVVIISHQQSEDFGGRSIMFIPFSLRLVSTSFLKTFSFPLILNWIFLTMFPMYWFPRPVGLLLPKVLLRYHFWGDLQHNCCNKLNPAPAMPAWMRPETCGLLLAMTENHIHWAAPTTKVNSIIPLTFIWWDLAQLMHSIRYSGKQTKLYLCFLNVKQMIRLSKVQRTNVNFLFLDIQYS